MIEPTDEMVREFRRVALADGGTIAAGLAAVLAIVERDYEPRRCDDPSWTGQRCTKPRSHDGGHEHRFSGTVWP